MTRCEGRALRRLDQRFDRDIDDDKRRNLKVKALSLLKLLPSGGRKIREKRLGVTCKCFSRRLLKLVRSKLDPAKLFAH